jgi:hypothetical protein
VPKGTSAQGNKCPREQVPKGTSSQGTKFPRDQVPKGPIAQGTKCPMGPSAQGTKGLRAQVPKGPSAQGTKCPRNQVPGQQTIFQLCNNVFFALFALDSTQCLEWSPAFLCSLLFVGGLFVLLLEKYFFIFNGTFTSGLHAICPI